MTLLCITNNMDDLRSCTVRDHHLSACGDDACSGCLPRPAEQGLLCYSCAAKFDEALALSVDLISHCRSIESGPRDTTGVRTAPGSRVILPTSWVQADTLYRALAAVAVAYSVDWKVEEPEWDVTASHHNGFHPDAPIDAVWWVTEILVRYVTDSVDRLRTKHHGAAEAVRYVHAVQTALHAFPLEEKPRRIRHIRCRTCQHESLQWRPPLEHLDPIVIQCSNPGCGALWDPQMIDFDMRVLREEIEAELLGGKEKAA
jgi:hypothetical protein